MSTHTLVIIASIVVIIPFILWFIRNWMKIVSKREYRWLNLTVIFSFLIALIIFIILMSVAFTT